MFRFSKNSLRKLGTVDEDLERVITRALALSPVDFAVVQGKRTIKEQQILYGKGRSASTLLNLGIPTAYAKPHLKKVTWTMNSNHLEGNAVDLAAYVRGAFDWKTIKYYRQIAVAVKAAAHELGVPIVWGGDWKSKKDWGHFEMDQEA